MCSAWGGMLWRRVSCHYLGFLFSFYQTDETECFFVCIFSIVHDYISRISLWHTWFDRDLGISGRVLVRTNDADTRKEKIEQRIVRIARPIARVSTLCIHLQTAEERGAFKGMHFIFRGHIFCFSRSFITD